MNELTIFKNENFGEVRTLTVNGEPWFVLKDVCNTLEIGNSRMVSERLENDEKGVSSIDTPGGRQEMSIVSESGLYKVIFQSRKETALKFQTWVTKFVIPQIRKKGLYATDELLNNPDLWIQALQELKSERAKNASLKETIEKDKSKVLFADAVSVSEGSILIGELAKILKGNGIEIGQNRLFERLRQDGYLIKRKGTDYNMPTQKAMELKLFKVKETAITHSDGHVTVSKTTKVTGKGQQYFVNMFLEDKKRYTKTNNSFYVDEISSAMGVNNE